MMRVGVIGVGDMGSGLALNLIKNGFDTTGHDLLESRLKALVAMGGRAAEKCGAGCSKRGCCVCHGHDRG